MNKTEFINAVAEKAGLSKVDGKKAVEAMVKTIQGEMKKGEKVSILGFGSFSVVEKASRKGVNPQTKKVINIPARKVIKFKPGTDLTRVVKEVRFTYSLKKKTMCQRGCTKTLRFDTSSFLVNRSALGLRYRS